VDIAAQRIDYARQHYRAEGLEFTVRDIREPLDDLGRFDFIWIRFVLEYYRSESAEMIRNAARALAPGGILCLVDLDSNCLRSTVPPAARANRQQDYGRPRTSQLRPLCGLGCILSLIWGLRISGRGYSAQPHCNTFKKNEKFNWIKGGNCGPIVVAFDEYPGVRRIFAGPALPVHPRCSHLW
jgi:SAM-dependent methyltransferase